MDRLPIAIPLLYCGSVNNSADEIPDVILNNMVTNLRDLVKKTAVCIVCVILY